MRKSHFLFFLIFISSSSLFAQAIIRGKVSDVSGETLIGAVVGLKANNASAVLTDLDGNFSVRVPEDATHTLVVSYVSYTSLEIVIPPLTKNQVLIKNLTLKPRNDLAEVEVYTKQVKSNDYYMENVKKNSATTIDYISSETMKKTGDPNVVAAIARVSGVSTNAGLVTVRGIGDRYVKTTLNGSRIPTLDPLTNNIKLDLFPSALVDNIIITKTASPDLPGDWSGAYLSVETKDYPENLIVSIESQIGYNGQTTFRDFISSDRSSTDWLGFDTGLRNRTHNPYDKTLNPNFTPSQYDELAALGVKDYYNSMGINSSWDQNGPESETYFKLGLVQLGLLAPAMINDDVSVNTAKAEYDAKYKKEAFSKIYPDGQSYDQGFKNNWDTKLRKAPLNFSQSFSVGDQTTLFKKTFGYLFGLRYGSWVRYDPNGVSKRVGAESQGYEPDTEDDALISRQTNGWSALVNLAYKLNGNNSVSFLFMPNLIGTNDVVNFTTMPDGTDAQEGRTTKNQFYEQRKQLIYQLKSEHFIPGPKMKIDFNASYTKGNSIAPDFKTVSYDFLRDNETHLISRYNFGTSVGEGVKRFYRYLSDNVLDSRLSAELPISKADSLGVRKLKFGGAYQRNDRKQDLYDYVVLPGNSGISLNMTDSTGINEVLDPDNFVMTNQLVHYKYLLNTPDFNFNIGSSVIKSAFAMVDYTILSFLRFSGGLRVEHASIFTDAVKYHNMGYKRDDPRRANLAGYQNVNPANINETSFLPSGNLIFSLKKNKYATMNFRLNYSQSVARPSIRELNDAAVYDNEFRTLIYGNSDLKIVHIKNYDFRFESYFKNGDNISASVFYKDFLNHIEMSFGSGGLSWNNVGKSMVRGIELEGKKSIIKNLDAQANVTFVQSNSQVIRSNFIIVDGIKDIIPLDTINRPMYGQAPFIVNTILTYKNDSIGFTATASYNVQGPRLVITGLIPGRPDVYELPRHTLDVKVSKTLGKHFTLSFLVRDCLNAPVRRAYKLPTGWVDYDKFRYGQNFLISVLYKL